MTWAGSDPTQQPNPAWAQTPAGWYPDPYNPPGVMRYWDGQQWTPNTHSGTSPVHAQDRQTGTLIGFGLFAVGAVGAGIALFTNVSLLTGTGTVWVGAVIACVAAIGAAMFHRVRAISLGIRIVCVILAIAAVASAAYDEHQLQQKRDQINQIFDSP